MKSSLMKSLTVAVLLGSAALGAWAQELRIGYVNSDRVLRELYASETGFLPTQDNQPMAGLRARTSAAAERGLKVIVPPRVI